MANKTFPVRDGDTYKLLVDQADGTWAEVVAVGGAGAITSTRKTVTTPGTAVALVATSTPCREVMVTALITNSSYVAIGGSAVLCTAGSEKGVFLAPGQGAVLSVNNVALLYLDALVAGEGVSFNYLA